MHRLRRCDVMCNDVSIDIEKFVQDTNIHDFVKTIKDNYTSFWKHQIKNSNKLSFYSIFKKHYNLQEYLNVLSYFITRLHLILHM